MPCVSDLLGKIRYSKKELRAIKKRKLQNKKRSSPVLPSGPRSKLRVVVYKEYKDYPSYSKELNMMKGLFSTPRPMSDAKIKTKLKPIKMDKFFKV